MIKLKNLYQKAFHELWLLKHRGHDYSCPFCGYSSDIMLPFGKELAEEVEKLHIIGGGRRNVRCPNCNSNDRERLLYIYLKEIAHIFDRGREARLLHIAPEPRLSQALLKTEIDYVCGDLFAEGYTYPEYVRNMDVLHLPFGDNTFDIILCNHVLEHIPEDRQAMRSVFRVLKPGGFALLQVPVSNLLEQTIEDFTVTDPHQREITFGQKDHCRLYGKDYVDRLQECGFEVEIKNISKEYGQFDLNPEENLFVCRKANRRQPTESPFPASEDSNGR